MSNKDIKEAITNIYRTNLKVKRGENLLIFTDNHTPELRKITKLIAGEGKDFTEKIIYATYPPTGSHGAEPPESLWTKAFGEKAVKKLKVRGLLKPLLKKGLNKNQLKEVKAVIKRFKNKAVNVVIALSYYSTTHTKFRYLLTKICGTRYVSMPLFEGSMLMGAMNVDWKEMAKRTREIAERINKAEAIEVETPNGTYISLLRRGRKARADTGIVSRKGSCSNLPAGEVFFAPVEGKAEGRLVLEWAPTHRLKSPITLEVKEGRVVEVRGDEEYVDFLKKKFLERPENANIA